MNDRTLRHAISDHNISVSNMIEISALAGLLIRKGLITQEEILEEVKRVPTDMLGKIRGRSK